MPVLLEDGAEDPAVAVEVGELRVPRLRVQIGDALEELRVGPVARAPRPRRGSTSSSWVNSSAVGCFLPRRVHQFAVGLFVPPHVAGVASSAHSCPGWTWQTMHWLVGMRHGELVLDRMARLVLRDRRVGLEAQALVAERRRRAPS